MLLTVHVMLQELRNNYIMEQSKGNNQNWTELLGIWIVTPLINLVVNWQLSKQGFRSPVSPDHTVGSSVNPSRSSIFLKLSVDFPEGTQPSWKFTEIPGAGGLWQALPTVYHGNSRGWGGSKVNMPFMGGMDIFWKYRIIDMLLARFLVANF